MNLQEMKNRVVTPRIFTFPKVLFATTCNRDSGCKQKEQSEVGDIPHLVRLVRFGREIFLYRIEKLNIFLGRFR